MSKYVEALDSTEKVFTEILKGTTLPQVIKVKILNCKSLKNIGFTCKVSDQTKFFTDDDVLVIINEDIFDMLDEEQKKIVADDLIASISHNAEKDTIKISKHDVSFHSGVLRKYGAEKTLNTLEVIRAALAQMTEKEQQ